MKAALLTEPGSLVVQDIDDPACPPGGLLIEVMASSICSSDVKMARSGHPALRYPRVLGHEVVGKVIESRIENVEIDDRMVQVWPGVPCGHCHQCLKGAADLCETMGILGFTNDGGFAQQMAVPRESVEAGALNLVPTSTLPEEAVLAEPLACCLRALERSQLKPRESILIFGGGPMGLMVALAAESQEMKATVVETDAKRRSLGRNLGLDVMSPEEAFGTSESERTRGMDGILLCTPEKNVDKDLIPLLAPKGRICVFSGLPAGRSKSEFDWNALHYLELTICGTYGCGSENNRKALELIASGAVEVGGLITHRLPLSKIDRALDLAAKREGLKCVINEFR